MTQDQNPKLKSLTNSMSDFQTMPTAVKYADLETWFSILE